MSREKGYLECNLDMMPIIVDKVNMMPIIVDKVNMKKTIAEL